MTYFKTGLGLTYADRFKSVISDESRARASGVTVKPSQAAGITAMAQIQADWPKKNITVQVKRDGVAMGPPTTTTHFVYKFADGTTRLSQKWNHTYYLHVKAGTSPPPIAPRVNVPDLTNVVLGSDQYFMHLCRAQGPQTGLSQGTRIAFDRKGWKWRYDTTNPNHVPKTIQGIELDLCKSKLKRIKNGGEAIWRFAAWQYSVIGVDKFAESRENATSRDHRPSACKDRVPPEQVAACQAYVSGGAGGGRDRGTIEGFIDDLESGQMSQEEFDRLTESRSAHPGSAPGEGFFGNIPPLYLAAGAVGIVLLSATIFTGGKK